MVRLPSIPIVVVLLLGAGACHRSTTATGAPDAGPAAPKKIPRPRVTGAGDLPADLARSKVTITVIKDRDLTSPVVASIALRDGAVSLGGSPSAHLSIDLDTLDSGIPIRNERVRNLFFETSGVGWDSAELAIPAIPAAIVASLAKHERVSRAPLDGTLAIHGRSSKVAMLVDAAYADDGHLQVKSAAPVDVKISDFGLTDNLRRLSAICMHDSIDDVVKVDVTLDFAPH